MSSLPFENAPPTKMKDISSGPLAVAKIMIGLLSTVRQREPPSEGKTNHIRLITIKPSHFCEKARWVLDLVEADPETPYYFTEDSHPPPFQAYETLKVTDEKVSTTPMIVFKDADVSKAKGETIMYDSAKIVKRFMPKLYPTEIEGEIDEMEADLGQRLGATLRCVAYYHLLSKKNLKEYHNVTVQTIADPTMVATVESKFVDKALENGLAAGMKKALGINKDTAEASTKAMREVFAELSKRLEESGGEYLMDTNKKSYGFTAADLTFAALAYPFICPSQMSKWCQRLEALPEEIRILSEELRATTAGQHVLKVYALHRLPKGETVVMMKYANRNKSLLDNISWSGVGLLGILSLLGIGHAVRKGKQ